MPCCTTTCAPIQRTQVPDGLLHTALYRMPGTRNAAEQGILQLGAQPSAESSLSAACVHRSQPAHGSVQPAEDGSWWHV